MSDTTTVPVHRHNDKIPITRVSCQGFGITFAEFRTHNLTQDDGKITCPRCLWVAEHPAEHPALATIEGGVLTSERLPYVTYLLAARWAGQIYTARFAVSDMKVERVYGDVFPQILDDLVDTLEEQLPLVAGWLPRRARERKEHEDRLRVYRRNPANGFV